MQNIPLDSIDEITPEWLTRVLSDGGYLTRGTVSEIQNRSHKSNWASNAVLRVSYSADALGEKPTKLCFKLCNPGPGTFGDSKLFILLVAPNSDFPIHDVSFSYLKKKGKYHLLLRLVRSHSRTRPTWDSRHNNIFTCTTPSICESSHLLGGRISYRSR